MCFLPFFSLLSLEMSKSIAEIWACAMNRATKLRTTISFCWRYAVIAVWVRFFLLIPFLLLQFLCRLGRRSLMQCPFHWQQKKKKRKNLPANRTGQMERYISKDFWHWSRFFIKSFILHGRWKGIDQIIPPCLLREKVIFGVSDWCAMCNDT